MSSPRLLQRQHGHSSRREKRVFSSTGLFYDSGQQFAHYFCPL